MVHNAWPDCHFTYATESSILERKILQYDTCRFATVHVRFEALGPMNGS